MADDDEAVRDYFGRLFPAPEYELHGAAGGLEALERIAADGFDMLILDLVMPDMDGLEVLRRVREIRPDILVFVVTGYPSEETTKEAVARGCVDYVHKPFDAEEIRAWCAARSTRRSTVSATRVRPRRTDPSFSRR